MTTLEQPRQNPEPQDGFFSRLPPQWAGLARGAVEAVVTGALSALITYLEAVEVSPEYAFVPALLVLLARGAEGFYDQQRRG